MTVDVDQGQQTAGAWIWEKQARTFLEHGKHMGSPFSSSPGSSPELTLTNLHPTNGVEQTPHRSAWLFA
jgi:hypothetical protein